jgi:phage shock protein PspC (stress-responsive transcriptional regulator)
MESTTPEIESPPSTPESEFGRRPEHDRVTRAGDGRMVAGVALGLADYFDVDPTFIRIAFVALTLLGGLAIPIYAAGWLLIPEEGAEVSVAEELLARERAR